jgi:creatinine amidohydrolase
MNHHDLTEDNLTQHTMRPYILSETNYHAIKDERFEMAVLPWGATEAHNYHLPYGTDNLESDSIAAESARIAWDMGARPIVLPNIPFGVNTGQRDIYLDISINPSTQLAILSDIADGLQHQGLYKLLIFNSHGGNDFKAIVREVGLKYPKMFISVMNWYQALDKSLYFEHEGDHADEMETSLMLYLRHDLVLPKDYWGEGKAKKFKINAFSEGWIWSERQWPKVTQDTGIGNPELATEKKGERFFMDLTLKIARVLVDICKTNMEDMYV